MLKECYYFDQSDWDIEDFYTLHLFLIKMIDNYDTTVGSYDGEKRINEIKNLDLSRMSLETRVLLYCVIISSNREFLLSLPNLKELSQIQPLSKQLKITNRKRIHNIPVYRKYGVIY